MGVAVVIDTYLFKISSIVSQFFLLAKINFNFTEVLQKQSTILVAQFGYIA